MTSGVNYSWGIRVSKKFEGSKFQCFVAIDNIAPRKNEYFTTMSNYQTYSISQNRFTSFKLGFSHKFGRLKAPDSIKESSSGQSGRI